MIKIIDNVTSPANASYMESLLIERPWTFLKSTAYNQFETAQQPYDPSWAYTMYNYDEIRSPLMTHAQSILIKALYLAEMPISKLIRIRGGMTTRTPYPVVHAPHVDWDNFHMTALYYVNDADGETIFYKEKRDETLEVSSFEWSKNREFTIDKKVQPKADRMVIFDGRIFHSSTSPTNADYRITINYNWLP
jgi:hypothetical protein